MERKKNGRIQVHQPRRKMTPILPVLMVPPIRGKSRPLSQPRPARNDVAKRPQMKGGVDATRIVRRLERVAKTVVMFARINANLKALEVVQVHAECKPLKACAFAIARAQVLETVVPMHAPSVEWDATQERRRKCPVRTV